MSPTASPDPPTGVVWTATEGALGAEIARPGARPSGTTPRDRLVFVHGFTQTGRSWLPIAEYFVRAGHEVVLVDLPGHATSSHVRADLRRTADLLAAVGGRAVYVGYSLGGRVCLHLALMYPHLVVRLAVIGAHPGLDDDDARSQRRDADAAVAARLRRSGVAAFVREWTTQPLFGDLRPSSADLDDRDRNTVEGLVSSLQLAGTGTQTSLWPRLRELTMPVLAIAGADDAKFAAIARQMVGSLPDGRCRLVEGAAHAAHLQRPDVVVHLLADFVDG